VKGQVGIIPAVVLALVLTGCAENVGWVIKPVPLEEKLVETQIARDEGLFVPDKILILDVDSLLINQRKPQLFGFGENPVSFFIEKLDKAKEDPNVKAVVLRINSPGGGVTASDIMHRKLRRFAEEKQVPVVAVLEDVGASGAYYLACGADTILAHETSVVGSIGVMVQTVSFSGTMKKLGIEAEAVTSGSRKDMASPLKPLDKEDLAILQGIVDEYYQRFLGVVARGRPELESEAIKKLADGRVFTGRQAKANGLIDDCGYLDDAIELAKTKSGSARVRVVMYHRPWGRKANAYAAMPTAPAQFNLLNITVPDLVALGRPRFLYLWTGRR
jgi:protease-4